MASTLAADVFVPELATRVATAQFPSELAVGFTGSPFVEVLPGVDDLGDEGDTVKFPRWDALGAFDDLSEDVAMTPEKLTSSVDTATVVAGGKAVEVTDFASLAARGDPSEEVGMQVARRAAYYADTKLIAEAETTALTETLAGTVTWDDFVSAIITHWGDRAFENIGGLVVHSKVLGDMLKLAEFKNADFNPVVQADLANLRGRVIGLFGGHPVYVSDRITLNAGTPNTHDNLILKRSALGLMFQRTLLVETDRDVLKKNTVIAADVRFAPHLFFAEPSPVIKWNTQ